MPFWKRMFAKTTDTSSQVAELVRLCDNAEQNYRKLPYEDARKAQKQIEIRIREIGQQLYDAGGERLMLRVHGDVSRRCPYGRYLEGAWGGIGTWLG
jgi:hypothetical protein